MAKAVGLDIGTHSVKIAEVEGNAKKYKLTRFAELELLPPAEEDDLSLAMEPLAELLRSLKIGRDTVVTSLPAHALTIREITVPFKNEDQIRKVVKFEAETHLHATAIEDVIVEFIPVGETKDGTRLVIFAAPKAEIRRRLQQLKAVEVDPRAVDLDVIATFNALSAAGLAGEGRNLIVADIGAVSTKLLLIQNGELRSVRSLRTGTHSISRQLESDLDLPFDEADQRQALPGNEHDLMVPASEVEDSGPETAKSATRLERDLVIDRRMDFIEKVSRELVRTMASMSASSRLDAFYVTGGGSRSPEVIQELSRRFDVAVEPLDLLQGIPHDAAIDEDAVNASGSVAIGAALKQIGAGAIDVDFRQEEFAFARKFEIVKMALAFGVAFVFILVFLYFLHLQRQVRRAELQYTKAYGGFAQSQYDLVIGRYNDTLGKDFAQPHAVRRLGELQLVESYHRTLLGIQDELVNELGVNPDIPKIRSSLTVLRELFERCQNLRETKIEYLLIKQLSLTQKTVRIKGVIGTQEDIGLLRQQLTGDKLFQEFLSRNQTPTSDGYVNLDVELTLAPEEEGE